LLQLNAEGKYQQGYIPWEHAHHEPILHVMWQISRRGNRQGNQRMTSLWVWLQAGKGTGVCPSGLPVRMVIRMEGVVIR